MVGGLVVMWVDLRCGYLRVYIEDCKGVSIDVYGTDMEEKRESRGD